MWHKIKNKLSMHNWFIICVLLLALCNIASISIFFNIYFSSVLKGPINKYFLTYILFQTIVLVILLIIGLLGASKKILNPIESLSKDINNYKFGIKPKKRKIHGEIDSLQNDFVDLVNALEEEKQTQSRIIASISHDIKTPLTSILGYSELLTNNNLSNDSRINYITKIHNKSLTMKEIIEEFDDYLSCNIKDQTKEEKITIKYLITYLNNYYKEDLKEKNITFKITTNCPSSAILVDLAKIKRVFSNIITNSIRHLDKPKKNIIITINLQKNHDIIFEIADNGTGTKEDYDKLFEPLYTTDPGRKISGLGLSICKEIIESHDGQIKASSNKYNGFSIIFKLHEYKE